MNTTYSLKINEADVICAISIVCRLNNIKEGMATATELQKPFTSHWKKQYESTTGKDFGRSISNVLQLISNYNPLHNPLIYNENNESWYVDEIYTTYDQMYMDYIKPNLIEKDNGLYSIFGYELNHLVINCLDYAFENTLKGKSITDYAKDFYDNPY